MDDLISRKALLEQECFMDDDNGFRCSVVLSTDVRRAPAVDAVEVVRCKDCKHSRERNECEKKYLVEEVLICTHPDCSDDCWFATWPDHWCRCGERRGNDGT